MAGDRHVAFACDFDYRDYEALPADGRRYEIHDGELSVTPVPSPQHQRVSGNLNEILRQHVKSRRLGELFYAPIDCILSETTVVQPDLVYLEASRLRAVSARGIEGPPTLVVEILSPATSLVDRSAKRQLYARHGVPFYWIVDPEERSIEVYALSEREYELVARAGGAAPVRLPPFEDLSLVPDVLWA